MKYTLFIALLLVFFFNTSYGQDCKVLVPEINTTYEGKCKKGLAHGKGEAKGKDHYIGKFKKGYPHGKGVYTWSNGDTYTGSFSKGKLDGKGLLVTNKGQVETFREGYFKDGEYVGKYKNPYKIISDQGIRKVDFIETNKGVNEVNINVYLNGRLVYNNISVRDNNNTTQENRNGGVVLTNVVFPLDRVQLSFQESGLTYQLIFDIYRENSWDVNISL